MNNTQLDAEYDAYFMATNVDGWATRCSEQSADPWVNPCQRPPGHAGDHASVLGMDPDTNDWVKWPAASVGK